MLPPRAAQSSLDAASLAVVTREHHVDARAARGSLLGGVALACPVCAGDEVVVWDLGHLAPADLGQGLTALLSHGAIWRGTEEPRRGRVGCHVAARGLPARWDPAVPMGDREGGDVGGCNSSRFIVIDLGEVSAAA